jgi:hypothetical protein
LKIILIASFFCLASYILSGQEPKYLLNTSPSIKSDFDKTPNWIQADSNRHLNYLQYPGTMNLKVAVEIIKSEKDFWKLLQAKTWCIDNYKVSVPFLIEMITDKTKVGIQNATDLIIPDRVATKELIVHSNHGTSINEDIFTIAGRCSHILNELTGENFALVHVATTKSELKIYQKLWKSWFEHL